MRFQSVRGNESIPLETLPAEQQQNFTHRGGPYADYGLEVYSESRGF